MARFPYHRLASEYLFQDLVWDISRYLLGEGVEKFAKGRDGGRDGRFAGKANRFPSETKPLTGKFIIQAKLTQDESSTFADAAFQRQLLKVEVPKAIKLRKKGELDHWIIFSNRRRSGDSSTDLEKELLKKVGCKSVHLRGSEELDGWLADMNEVVTRYGLDALLIPFRVDPVELREVIEILYNKRSEALATATSRWDFKGYKGIATKNKINRLTKDYFNASIRDKSEPHFAAIKAFLENPRNRVLAERYHEAAAEIQGKAMAFRDRFPSFDLVIEQLCDAICLTDAKFQQLGKKRVLRVLLHYMYANCDIGKKSE
ncbi:MAG: hypothetical protein PCFJNLEI_02954 [Verrucomicrobiae bacterium]|nr:hypothetical protein [Verrucomicrobiae bacterium]